jgi:hypothetical protein
MVLRQGLLTNLVPNFGMKPESGKLVEEKQ